MNWESIGAIAEVIGVVAILVSIVYLATQIRQSNEIARAEAEREVLQSWMHGLEGFVDSHQTTEFFLKGLADFDALTSIEKTRLSYRLVELNMVYISALENEKKGLIAPHLVEAFGNAFFSYVNSPGGRQWWALHREFFTNMDLIDERIAREGDSFPSFLDTLPYHKLELSEKQ
jgi:hypothetical protein